MAINADRVWRSLTRLHAVVEAELERAVRASSGLSLAAYDVLTEVIDAPSPLTMSELADRVVLSRTRVSRLVDELDRDGLTQRLGNPEDRRSAFVESTELGAERHSSAVPAYRSALNNGLKAALTPKEFLLLGETLDRMSSRER